jgi:uncharacterized OB-fold protein
MPINQPDRGVKFIEEKWFKDTPEGIVLVGSRCEACKRVFFPTKEVCPECFVGELKDISLSKRGILHSYTFSIMGIPGMEAPYVVGFIDLPEGVKLFSLITDCEPWDKVLKIGMEMEMVTGKIKKDESGNEIFSYKFRPVNKGAEK